LLLIALTSCSRPVEFREEPSGAPLVRVLLIEGGESVKISIPGPYEVRVQGGEPGARRVAAGVGLRSTKVWSVGRDVLVDDLIRTPYAVEFVPERVPVELNGRRYRGRLRVRAEDGKLHVVNVLDLEGYLQGVVPLEVFPSWPGPALQAQAIAARTYALVKMDERHNGSFDVRCTTKDQAYGGVDAEDPRTNEAVEATAGAVLCYRGRPFTAFFHSCCGGRTANGEQVFADPTPTLRGVPCGYCSEAKWYKWSAKLSLGELGRRLGMPDLTDLGFRRAGADGRVVRVTLHRSGGGPPPEMTGTAFRERVGGNTLRSARFEVRRDGDRFVFEGRGYGHGVGLCQWGAKGMADAGKTCQEILEHYYPGSEGTKVY